jgi:hypothetical protein
MVLGLYVAIAQLDLKDTMRYQRKAYSSLAF